MPSSLSSRLVRLESAAPPPVEFDGPMGEDEIEWNRRFAEALQVLLGTMSERHAGRVVVALQGGGWWPDPVARRCVKMTLQVIPTPDVTWFPMTWRGWIGCPGSPQGPFVLAAETCALLDQHPTTVFEWFDCQSCGYLPGERPSSEWFPEWIAAGRPETGALKTHVRECPLCGGRVAGGAYMGSRSRCLQARQQPNWARERGVTCPHEPRCPASAAAGE
jgi:hypothetical protein